MFYAIMLVHWFADFICQSRDMANNKSSSHYWLVSHIIVYTTIMSIFGYKYALINGLAHLVTDFCTSRGTSYFWKRQNIHAFFSVIGFDQFLHVTILYWSLHYAHSCIPRFI